MRTPPPEPLALPPALTYLLSRALADCARVRPGARLPASRLGGLFRDTARYLADAGASPDEIEAVLEDAVTIAGVSPDPALHAVLEDAAARVRAGRAD